MMQAWRISAIAATVAVVGCLSGPAAAQLDRATDEVNRTTTEGAASQERIDEIDRDTEELVRNYRSVLRQLEDLRAYNQQRRELIAAQEEEKQSIAEQIQRVQTIERDIVPLMSRMIEALDLFVQLDAPFRLEERRNRIERLRETAARADVEIAEKFRVVLEAYQIENDYGRTIDAYTGQIELDGQTREVDFFMVGRVAFYYQTLDRSETAIWNQSTRDWQMLDSKYAGPVRTGMDMAREFIPPELLVLPVFGPEEGGSESGIQLEEIEPTDLGTPASGDDAGDGEGDTAGEDDAGDDAAADEDTAEEGDDAEDGDDTASDSDEPTN